MKDWKRTHIFSEHADMTFGMEKCKVVTMQQRRMKHSNGLKPDAQGMK